MLKKQNPSLKKIMDGASFAAEPKIKKRHIITVLMSVLILTLITVPDKSAVKYDAALYEPVKEDIILWDDFVFEDKEKFNDEKNKIINEFPEVYLKDELTSKKALHEFESEIKKIEEVINLKATIEEKQAKLEQILSVSDPFIYEHALVLSKNKEKIINKIKSYYDPGIIATEVEKQNLLSQDEIILVEESQFGENITKTAVSEIKPVFSLTEARDALSAFINKIKGLEKYPAGNLTQKFIKINLRQAAAAAENLKKEAIEKIQTPEIEFSRGHVLLRQGEILTPNEEKILKEYLNTLSMSAMARFLSYFIYFLLIILIIAIYISKYLPEVAESLNKQILIFICFLFPIAAAKLFLVFTTFSPAAYLTLPVAVATAVITILIRERIAVIIAIFAAATISILMGFNYLFLFMFSITSFIVAFTSYHIRKRSFIIKSGIYITLSYWAVIIILFLMGYRDVQKNMAEYFIFSALSGLIIFPTLTIGLLPLFETAFKITTDINLLELSNLNLPIFKEMLIKASGTYQHSLMVGTLAENAADAIEANTLLARVGAYYHDIGKMIKADYFAENQSLVADLNKHSDLKPSLSVSVLKSHTKLGVELAKKHKLPKEIIDIILQHHGTTFMKFFYHKALEGEKNGGVNKEEFKYDGPVPQTKEAAIVMLADSVEAAARTLKNPTPAKIEEMVVKIITEKFEDNQLDDCNLTFKGLTKIRQSFVKVLTSMYHTRIEYPDDKEIQKLETENKQ